MTIAIKGNTQGGVIEANGVAAANISANGFPFMKNKLINGEVTRINQRGVANWAAVSNDNYGYDRWKKIDASNMTQIIEEGNFRPNTVHTLSGIGVTTQQITSPASGNWTLPNIPISATNVQVEEGLEATPFEVRHIAFEMALCQRYWQRISVMSRTLASGAGTFVFTINFSSMRITPVASSITGATNNNISTNAYTVRNASSGYHGITTPGAGDSYSINGYVSLDAEL